MGTDVGKGGAEPASSGADSVCFKYLKTDRSIFEDIKDAKNHCAMQWSCPMQNIYGATGDFSADGLAVRMAAEKKNTDIAAGLLNQGKAMDR